MKKVFSQCLLLLGSCSALNTEISGNYMDYLARFGKSYSSVEEFQQREIYFYKLDAWINEYNSDPTMSAQVGHNLFSDWSPAERTRLYGQGSF